MTQRPHDDPFEWLGQGIIMDQSNHAEQNPMNILPVNGSVSEEATDLKPIQDYSPFDTLGQGPLDQTYNMAEHGNKSTDNIMKRQQESETDPFEMLTKEIAEQPAPTLFDQTKATNTPNPMNENSSEFNNSELLVEDVMSVDENQSVVSAADDTSYVVQELFPLVKSPMPAGIPSIIFEDQSNDLDDKGAVGKPGQSDDVLAAPIAEDVKHDHHIMSANQMMGLLSIPAQPTRSNRISHTQSYQQPSFSSAEQNLLLGTEGQLQNLLVRTNANLPANGCSVVGEFKQSPLRNERSNNSLHCFNSVPDTATTAPSESHQQPLESDLLQLSSGPVSELLERVEPISLYDEPPVRCNTQQLSLAGAAGDGCPPISHSYLHSPRLSFGPPMGSSPTPLINRTSNENGLNIERAVSNPSVIAVATIATAASTTYDDDSDSDNSVALLRETVNVAKSKPTRRGSVEESYALFNKEGVKPRHESANDVTSDDEDSLQCREEFLIGTKKRPMSSRVGKQIGASIVSDEEIAISPGMVGHTSFDEDEESNVNKSGTKSHYKKLRGNNITNAKPSTKRIIAITTVVLIVLIAAISVLISLVVNTAEKSSLANPTGPTRVETSNDDAIEDVVISSGNESEIEPNTTISGAGVLINSTPPSSHPSSHPSLSSLPTVPLPEASISFTYSPSTRSSIPSVAPTTKTYTPSSMGSSSFPTYSYGNETSDAPSETPTKFNSTIPPSSVASSAASSNTPTLLNSTLSQSPSSLVCNSSDGNISSDIHLIWIDDDPCANFIVELCVDNLETGPEWAIVRFVTSDPLDYQDDFYYDDYLYYGDQGNNTNTSDTKGFKSSHIEDRAYYLDQRFSVTGHESAIVCLGKGFYHFIIHESLGANSYALQLENGKQLRPMSVGNYTHGVEKTSFDVTDFDIMGTNTSSAPLPASQSNISSYHNTNSTGLMTSSGADLVYDISKAYGILFDLETGESPLTVVSMELYLDTSFLAHYEIHTKEGSWKGKGNDLSGFRQVSHGSITGMGVCQQEDNCTLATISSEEFQPILLPSMSRHSFYVTLTTDDLIYQHLADSGGINYDDVEQASDSELTVYKGAAVLKYPLELADPTTDFRPGGFIGRLIYEEVGDSDFDVSVSSCRYKSIVIGRLRILFSH